MASDKNFEELISHRYDDIIDRPRPVSQKHAHMSLYDRAAQFAPYAALTGYESVIGEEARYTDSDVYIDDSCREKIDRMLAYIRKNIQNGPEAAITYFEPDNRKSGGSFITVKGKIKKIEEYDRTVLFTDGRKVVLDSIRDVELENPENFMAEKTES